MSDLSDRIRDLIHKVASFVPGFSGYVDKETRRASDSALRERLAQRLDRVVSAIERQTEAASHGGSMELIDELGRAGKAAQRARDRLRYASHGYSGFFDPVQVDQVKLEKLYQFDVGLVEAVEALQAQSKTTLSLETARTLTAGLRGFDDQLDERDALLKQGA
ncbi:MAG TPA: hypothetical protein VGB99_16700 [Acidobacteriota bacterium]